MLAAAATIRLRERYGVALNTGDQDFRCRWITCAEDGSVLTRILARCVVRSKIPRPVSAAVTLRAPIKIE